MWFVRNDITSHQLLVSEIICENIYSGWLWAYLCMRPFRFEAFFWPIRSSLPWQGESGHPSCLSRRMRMVADALIVWFQNFGLLFSVVSLYTCWIWTTAPLKVLEQWVTVSFIEVTLLHRHPLSSKMSVPRAPCKIKTLLKCLLVPILITRHLPPSHFVIGTYVNLTQPVTVRDNIVSNRVGAPAITWSWEVWPQVKRHS